MPLLLTTARQQVPVPSLGPLIANWCTVKVGRESRKGAQMIQMLLEGSCLWLERSSSRPHCGGGGSRKGLKARTGPGEPVTSHTVHFILFHSKLPSLLTSSLSLYQAVITSSRRPSAQVICERMPSLPALVAPSSVCSFPFSHLSAA